MSSDWPEEPEKSDARDFAQAAILGGLGGALTPLGPIAGGAIAGAGQATWEAIMRRRAERMNIVVARASTDAELEVDALLERMASSEAHESILMKALLAAGSAHVEARLVVLTNCIRKAALTDDEIELGAIDAVVAVLAELGPTHLAVLASLTASHNALGLIDGPLPPTAPENSSLNRTQVLLAFPQLDDTLDPVIATLQRHGLIVVEPPSGGMSFGPKPTLVSYRIAPFGRRILDDLKEAAAHDAR